MKSVTYDKYYQKENLFGNPFPELINFYKKVEKKGRLLDLGCGQGRDSIALARLGFEVVGVDNSKVGIEQLNSISKREKLTLSGIVEDMYNFKKYGEFDFILLDSIFHFGIKERKKEKELLNRIIKKAKTNAIITICIQNSVKKIKILNAIILDSQDLEVISRTELLYIFDDKESGHKSETDYEMIILRKL